MFLQISQVFSLLTSNSIWGMYLQCLTKSPVVEHVNCSLFAIMNNVTVKYLSKKLVYCLLKLFFLAYTFRSKGKQMKESEYFEGSWNISRGLVHVSLA